MTTRNVVEYFPALAKCGNASLESRYRRIHCAKRNHAGRQLTIGLTIKDPDIHCVVSPASNQFPLVI